MQRAQVSLDDELDARVGAVLTDTVARRFDVTLQMLRTWDPVSDESDAS